MIDQLQPNVIRVTIITGRHAGRQCFLLKIKLSPGEEQLQFQMQRFQFPVKLCYAMTIHKSQGQSLKVCGVYLRQPVFTHGQLYVACSRVTSQDGLHIMIVNGSREGRAGSYTRNPVYVEVL